MHTAKMVIRLVLISGLLTALGCGGSAVPAPEIVSGHTGGVISAAESVRVRLNRNVKDPSALNRPLEESPIELRPAVAGTAVWTAPDRLQFTPKTPLESGRNYTATVHLEKILPDLEGVRPFEFTFATMEQSFKVEVEGLEVRDASAPLTQSLEGRVVTADVADPEGVEAVLGATIDGAHADLVWRHPTGSRHEFVIEGITRTQAAGSLTLRWDGEPIGAALEGDLDIRIPPRDEFSVLSIRARSGDERLVEIRFTDALDPSQDLRGLVRIGDHTDLRAVAEGSVLRIYTTGRWEDEEAVRVDPAIRSAGGAALGAPATRTVYFEAQKPQATFSGRGVIVPTTGDVPTLPIEAVALDAVRIEATHIFESNMAQFFQVNTLEDDDEIHRVGRPVWTKRVVLDTDGDGETVTRRYGLDLRPLVEGYPGGMYRLRLTFNRGDIDYPCGDEEPLPQPDESGGDTWDGGEQSYWDLWEEQQNTDWSSMYDNRENPCHPGYYRSFYDHDIEVSRNILLSDIGLTAKAGHDGSLVVLATDLRTAAPRSGAKIRVLDYQQQLLAEGVTGEDGLLYLEVDDKPFLVVAEDLDQVGYLKLDDGLALSVSNFDVSGAEVSRGIKGFLYAERGVWRPGDTMHIGLILSDPEERLPADHPVVFELRNPQDQLVARERLTRSANDFYVFEPATDEDAPTGTYSARATIGGVSFSKSLKVATIRPNRLKVELEPSGPEVRAPNHVLTADLEAAWLHGGSANGLRATVEARLESARTVFDGFPDFIFDDPTRSAVSDDREIFDGILDAAGRTTVAGRLDLPVRAPGKLTAVLTTRVFEHGGGFSITEDRTSVSPFERYVGVRTPKGDKARGMILTDEEHRIDLALLDQEGAGLDGEVEVALYKIDWRWWWEKGEGNLAEYAATTSHTPVASGKARLETGRGAWTFQVDYPDWGRYLLIARDLEGGHRSGRVLYMDWPGWAGKARKDSAQGAAVLDLSVDKEKVEVGETVTLSVPSAAEGRILVTLENGTRVLHSEYVEAAGERTRYTFTATADMVPNIYAAVSFIQPHDHSGNDLPIRMYGVLPVEVVDPDSTLEPVIKAPEEMRPEESAAITVSEADGRPMSYTLAVVDEGLLGLTGFSTPNPWRHFFSREALGVTTWDLFDEVVGAYGAALERLLAIGGDEAGRVKPGQRKTRRFPPMVRFLGPFDLEKNGRNTHELDIPLYVGAVRLMVVAGSGRSFGSAEAEVPVRKPLMVLGTLPRLLAPGESVDMPVAVFTTGKKSARIEVEVSTEGPVEVQGPENRSFETAGPGEKSLAFALAAVEREGPAVVTINARGAGEKSAHRTDIMVRRPGTRITEAAGAEIQPGESWRTEVAMPGVPGSNRVTLEVSRIPPVDIGRRLEALVRYPYGCLEQTTSSVFPQLYLDRLVSLDAQEEEEIATNIKAAIQRLGRFQGPDGGMRAWPSTGGGFWGGGSHAGADEWATSYAGHFLLQAKRAGYVVPPEMLQAWEDFQRTKARSWITGEGREALVQAYRLHTLALAGAADLSAMNRMREAASLDGAATWQLAAAYQLAGQPETARELGRGLPTDFPDYTELAGTYGSRLRDRALALHTLALMGDTERTSALAKEISETLASDSWLSTQATAYALLALAEAAGAAGDSADFSFRYSWSGGAEESVRESRAIARIELNPGDGASAALVVTNDGEGVIYPRSVVSGLPPVGSTHSAEHGLRLVRTFELESDEEIDPARLDQGTDFRAVVTVTNPQPARTLRGLALSIPAADGWEIGAIETDGPIEYRDVRDDRADVFFDLEPGASLTVTVRFNAAFVGRYALPMTTVEAMYDATISARRAGGWVRVVAPGS